MSKEKIQRKMNSISRAINKLDDMISECDDLPDDARIFFEAGGGLCIVDQSEYRGSGELLMESATVCFYDCGGF